MSEDWRVAEMALLTERVVKLEALLGKLENRIVNACEDFARGNLEHVNGIHALGMVQSNLTETLREIREARKEK